MVETEKSCESQKKRRRKKTTFTSFSRFIHHHSNSITFFLLLLNFINYSHLSLGIYAIHIHKTCGKIHLMKILQSYVIITIEMWCPGTGEVN